MMTDLSRLHAEDLALAYLCSTGDRHAIKAFETRFGSLLHGIYAGWRLPQVSVDDFRQLTFEHILVVSEGRSSPRLRDYAGRGRLDNWLRMTASRLLVDLSRKRIARPTPDQALVAAILPEPDMQRTVLRGEYRPRVQQAIQQALRSLDSKARNLLRHRFVYGMRLEEIATLYQVHRVTVSKQLSRARTRVLEQVRSSLRDELGHDGTVDSIIAMCRSQLEINLASLLESRDEVPEVPEVIDGQPDLETRTSYGADRVVERAEDGASKSSK